mmetsp:Transcript_15900/g.43575  ORF Transcript_15900/g.43575 Transcript_15900/m.43575 type:complete len:649 (+) Transcript_15900:83-2029(+)
MVPQGYSSTDVAEPHRLDGFDSDSSARAGGEEGGGARDEENAAPLAWHEGDPETIASEANSSAQLLGGTWPAPAQATGSSDRRVDAGGATGLSTATHAWRRCAAVAGGLSAFVALAAAAHMTSYSSGIAANASQAVELWFGGTSKPTYETWSVQTGCKNWRQIVMGQPSVTSDLKTCAKKCLSTTGCKYFNWQEGPHNECNAGGGKQGSCTLWKDTCSMQYNKCMHLYKIVPGRTGGFGLPSAVTWVPKGLSMGCTNWRSILIGDPVILASVHECGSRCASTKGCKDFNYQVGPPDSCYPAGGHQGTCSLFKAGCKQIYNDCMDLYKTTSRYNVAYVAELANSVALTKVNEALEEQRVEINKKLPADMAEAMRKKPMFIDEPDMKVEKIYGMESLQILKLKATSVNASVVKGVVKAKMIMVAKPLKPLYIPHAKGKSGGATAEFRAMIYGTWVEALHMEATIVNGPPQAITEVTVGEAYAGFGGIDGKCLSDFLGICNRALRGAIESKKWEMRQSMAESFHDELQAKFDDEVPIYPDSALNSSYCLKPNRACLRAVEWAKKDGVRYHPNAYHGLTKESSLADFQNELAANHPATKCVPFCDPQAGVGDKEAKLQSQLFGDGLSHFSGPDVMKSSLHLGNQAGQQPHPV